MMALLCAFLAASPQSAAAAKLLREGRPAEALPLLEEARRIDARNAAVATDLGSTLLRLGRRTEAEQQLRAAIALDARSWPAYVALAALLSDDDRRWDLADDTLSLLDRGIARARGEVARAGLHLARADFLRSVGRTAQAREELQALRAVDLPPAQQRRIAELLDRVAADERLRAGEDWPEPNASSGSWCSSRRRTRWRGGSSASSSQGMVACWKQSAPTRRCGGRSLSNLPGPSFGSCEREWRSAAAGQPMRFANCRGCPTTRR
jgi:predicted O-linked N-acetylglucosamine transferase (SPINDLY family)